MFLEKKQPYVYEAGISSIQNYLAECQAAAALLDQGVIRMVFLEGQEDIAAEWLASRRQSGKESTLPELLSKHRRAALV